MSTVGYTTSGQMDINTVIQVVRENIIKGRKKSAIKALAGSIVKNVDIKNPDAVAKAVYDYLRRNITYTTDPVGGEFLQDAIATLQTKTGDCDDFTTLGSSILQSLGINTRIAIIKQNGQKHFSHIYFEYQSKGGKWIPFDAIVNQKPGWEAPAISQKRVYQVDTGAEVKSARIGFVDPVTAYTTGAAVVSFFSDTKKAVHWLTGKNSILGKWFGNKNTHIVEADFIRAFNDAFGMFGYGQADLDWFHRLGKSSNYDVYLKVQGKRVTGARFSSISQGLEILSKYILTHPKPGTPFSTLKAGDPTPESQWPNFINPAAYSSAQKPVPVTQPVTTPAPISQPKNPSSMIANQAPGQDWPVMPENPSGLNSTDLFGLGQALSKITAAAGLVYLKARSYGINETAPKPPASVLYPEVVKYWNAVNDYRSEMISRSQGGSGTGKDTGIQEAGMSTGTKVFFTLAGLGTLAAIASNGSKKK